MTVDFTLFHESNAFLSSKSRSFYPVKIPCQHEQLRHYISTIDADIIYFLSNKEVHAIHIPTCRRQRLASLNFPPTCIGVGYGWVCVGGRAKGDCAFIDIRESQPFTSGRTSSSNTEVDALLPLDLDPHSRLTGESYPGHGIEDTRQTRQRPKVHAREMAKDIINAITIHKLVSGRMGTQDEVVAVISTNDSTVQIYSLDQQQILQILLFPLRMNHASMSPDGSLLMSCGDEGRAFFHRRQMMYPSVSQEAPIYAKYDWQEMADVRLDATIAVDPCFSTAFSPSGHICAVGSQFGTITVFDTRLIREGMDDDEAVVDILKSSRPLVTSDYNNPGAVRSMAFGPAPWDLLAWAEDRGRFCVTDLRSGFRSRQTVEIDLDSTELERIDLSVADKLENMEQEELEREAQFLQRHQEALNSQDGFAAVRHAADYIEEAAERRRNRQRNSTQGESQSDPDPLELTEAEREILESLRVQRLSENRAGSRDQDGVFSIHYLNPNLSSSQIPSMQNSLRQYLRERNNERNNSSSSRAFPPRRRQSVVISNSNTNSSNSSSRPSGLTPISNSTSLSTSPARLTSIPTTSAPESQRSSAANAPGSIRDFSQGTTSPSEDPWQTTSAAMASIPASSTSENNLPRYQADNEALLRLIRNGEMRDELNRRERRRELENARAQIMALTTTHPSEHDVLPTESSSEMSDNRLQARMRQRERESTLRRERLRNVQAVTEEAEAIARIEPLDRMRLARLRQLRERSGQLEGEFRSAIENEATTIMRYLREMGSASPGGVRQRGGEPWIQGLGWGSQGRELFVATEDGILRYEVNLGDRKALPSMQPR